MNRRSFLKKLAIVGAAVIIPIKWTVEQSKKIYRGKYLRIFIDGKEMKPCTEYSYIVEHGEVKVLGQLEVDKVEIDIPGNTQAKEFKIYRPRPGDQWNGKKG